MTMSKKGGIRKVIVWIIIILIVIGALFALYNYMSQNDDFRDTQSETAGDISNENSQQQIVGEQIDEEKPPRPPE